MFDHYHLLPYVGGIKVVDTSHREKRTILESVTNQVFWSYYQFLKNSKQTDVMLHDSHGNGILLLPDYTEHTLPDAQLSSDVFNHKIFTKRLDEPQYHKMDSQIRYALACEGKHILFGKRCTYTLPDHPTIISPNYSHDITVDTIQTVLRFVQQNNFNLICLSDLSQNRYHRFLVTHNNQEVDRITALQKSNFQKNK